MGRHICRYPYSAQRERRVSQVRPILYSHGFCDIPHVELPMHLLSQGNSYYSRCSLSTASLLHSLLSGVSKSIRAVKITMDAATNHLWRPPQILDCFTTSSVCWLFRTLSNCLCGRPSPRIKSCDGFVITKWYEGVDMQRKRKGRDSSNVSEGCWNVYLCVAATSKVERKSRIREKWKISQAIW